MGISYDRERAIEFHQNEGDFKDNYYVYVNAYEVTLGYGGAEEGGWWFDVGSPLSSIQVKNNIKDINRAYDLIEETYIDLYSQFPERSSTASDAADLTICIENELASPKPDRKPHYE